jgi:hypothetical protein
MVGELHDDSAAHRADDAEANPLHSIHSLESVLKIWFY